MIRPKSWSPFQLPAHPPPRVTEGRDSKRAPSEHSIYEPFRIIQKIWERVLKRESKIREQQRRIEHIRENRRRAEHIREEKFPQSPRKGVRMNDGLLGASISNEKTCRKAKSFKRKAVKVLLKGEPYFARPDTCSDQNIMTEAFATNNKITIDRRLEAKRMFQLGTGKQIQSIGQALVPFKLFGVSDSEEYRWFHVFANCPVPLILGKAAIQALDLFGFRKHLLVNCPFEIGKLPTLKFLGSNRGGIEFSADGKKLRGLADTGSDLDFMSQNCAIKNGYSIDQSVRMQVMLADETIVETIGQVTISSTKIASFDDFGMTFHVLSGLPCDIIFSEEFLSEMDLFATFPDILGSDEEIDENWLKTIVNLGPVQNFLHKFLGGKKKKMIETESEQHDRLLEIERYHRSSVNKRIAKIKDEQRAVLAKQAEAQRRRTFDREHERCSYCTVAIDSGDG